MYRYKIAENGQAYNLSFKPKGYVAEEGEFVCVGDRLPPIETLHTQEYLDAQASIAYIDERKKEFNARGATIENLVIAMWENDQDEIDCLEAIRQSVKTDIPKPT